MRNIILSAVALASILAASAPAQALNTKSYVSNTGNDANNCASVATACASFQHAQNQTTPGGEITVVNTGSYGAVTFSQSVHITNDGAGEASIIAPASIGLLISAGVGDVISVRGLVIDGQFNGFAGILISAASAVHIQNCVIRNFQAMGAFGIELLGTKNAQLFVSDTIIFNNGSNVGSGGLLIEPSGTLNSFNVVLDRINLENNVVGLLVNGSQSTGNGAHVIIRDSVVSGNASDGIRALSAPGKAPAFVLVEHTTSVNNAGTGILANGPHATMLLDDNTIARNGVGISAVNSGQLISYGNNKVNNNLGPDGVPTGSYSPI